jgi:hypothetical protein
MSAAEKKTISVSASSIRPYSAQEALSFANLVLGEAGDWSPSLISYRLSSSFQQDWKLEVGCWLLHADKYGFLERIKKRLKRALLEAAAPEVTGARDSAHRILLSELAPAKTAYYLLASGWKFEAWEPPVKPKGDIDIRFISPTGITTDIQVKAPEGDIDSRVLSAVSKGLTQLQYSSGPGRIVVVVPQSVWPLDLNSLSAHLIGSTIGYGGKVTLSQSARGVFILPENIGVSAVVEIHLLRGIDETLYKCTVLNNPWVASGITFTSKDFPFGRVCTLEANKFKWTPEAPNQCHVLTDGAIYLPDE